MFPRGLFPCVALAALAFLSGCAAHMDPAKVARIVPGSTTWTEAKKLLGKPDSLLGSQGWVLARYLTVEDMGRDELGWQMVQRSSSLDLLSDPDGVIQKIHRYDNRTHIRARIGQERLVGPDLSPEALAWIKVQKTTAAEMKDALGEPSEELLGFRGTLFRRWAEIKWPQGTVYGVLTFLEVEFDEHGLVTSLSTEKKSLRY
jgi:hypothetical protein